MRPFDKLVNQVREAGYNLPDDLELQRTYAGHVQKSAGAWSWVAVDKDGSERLAGYIPVSQLVGKTLEFSMSFYSDTIEVDAT